jgi:hypothetical protein
MVDLVRPMPLIESQWNSIGSTRSSMSTNPMIWKTMPVAS